MTARIVLSTTNQGKVTEIVDRLGDLAEWVPRPDDVPPVVEDAPDLLGNARLKAWALAAATGLPALADDTGLEVAALDGAPGVISARYAGPEEDATRNVAKLLRELEGIDDRTARFRTVLVLALPDGTEVVAEGAVEGTIATAPRGQGGFGYDPVFVPNGDHRTFAEMPLADKQALSHRGRALDRLEELFKSGGELSEKVEI